MQPWIIEDRHHKYMHYQRQANSTEFIILTKCICFLISPESRPHNLLDKKDKNFWNNVLKTHEIQKAEKLSCNILQTHDKIEQVLSPFPYRKDK